MTDYLLQCKHSKEGKKVPSIMDLNFDDTLEEILKKLKSKGLNEVPGKNYLEGIINHEYVLSFLCTNENKIWCIVFLTCDERDTELLKILLEHFNKESEILYQKFLLKKENKRILNNYFDKFLSQYSNIIKEDKDSYRCFPHTLSYISKKMPKKS